jgi:large subunit ribosomal protein L6
MSRIGKLPIPVPQGVKIRVEDRAVVIEGAKGSERHDLPPKVDVELRDGTLLVTRQDDTREGRALHGLTRKLLANIVRGVSTGFVQTLEIVGVGYRAEVKGDTIQLALGYSHPIVYQLPPQVKAKVDKQTVITLEASSRHVLGEVASQIRRLRPPEPYKGKGIKYAQEHIRRKAGKAAGAGAR